MFDEYAERLRKSLKREYLIAMSPIIWLFVFGTAGIVTWNQNLAHIALGGFTVILPRMRRCHDGSLGPLC